MFIVYCITLWCSTSPWGSDLGPPASEGRSSPTGLWVQLPSGPLVPPLVPLLSHLASAVGEAPWLLEETPYYRRESLTVGDNPLLNNGILATERESLTIVTANLIVRDFISSYSKIPSKRLLSQRISLLSQSDKGFFISPLSEDFFTTPVRERILY